MDLKNFENDFSEKILGRGLEYYKDGAVISLERVSENEYTAEVAGSELYDVEIHTDGKGNIISAECDCPYDMGLYCKHIAAVLYKLREENGDAKKAVSNKISLPEMLGKCKKCQLIEIILEKANEDKGFKKYICLRLSDSGNTKALLYDLKKIADSYFSEYSDSYDLIKAAHVTFLKADNFKNVEDKFYIYAGVLSICENNLGNIYDDEDYSIFEIMENCSEKMEKLAEKIIADADEKTVSAVWDILMSKWNGENDYDSEDRIFPALCHFGKIKSYRKKLDEILISFSSEYNSERVEKRRYELVRRFGSRKEKNDFIDAHLNFEYFRNIAIDNAISAKNYGKAEQLALDGLNSDSDKRWGINRWHRRLHEIYKLSGDKEKLEKVCRTLVIDGDSALYGEWKSLIPKEKRSEEIARLINNSDNRSYENVILEEKMTDRIYELCLKTPRKITEYFCKIKGSEFEEKARLIYKNYILKAAESASDRKAYRDVCALLKRFAKECSSDTAKIIAADLRQAYCRRPAFMNELGKAGF